MNEDAARQDEELDDGCFDINDFCEWAGISRPYWYVLKKHKLAPKTKLVGGKEIIPKPYARKWRDGLPEASETNALKWREELREA